ncbi:restriction endonuclease subunit S [Roseomonas gilardii]|uniref:restriction endonuclease subunit S n=1 Tax=Roseomonas gilardii TaxID=257708 RepID=UPI0011A19021|nr:restriction endonuclease subunit S [Roseomonas gilardii]
MEVKSGYKLTEVGVIPNDWIATTVGELIHEGVIDKPLDGNHGNIHPKSDDFVPFGIPFVMANNVQGGELDLVNCSFIRKKQADSLRKGFSKTGDVLLTHKATIGNTAIVGEIPWPYIMLTPQVTYYRVIKKEKLDNFYLKYYFDGSGFQSTLRALAGGGTRAYIGISSQHQLPVILPTSSDEQRAMATALSDVDALLGALDRLIAKKRDLKQAAMQQLLTGQTRLPGFGGEWEVKRLGDVAEIVMGQSPSSSSYNSAGNGLPLIQGNADIIDRKAIRRVFTTQITKRGKAGDVLLSVRAPVGEVSRTTFDVCLGRGVCAVRSPNDFVYHVLIFLEPSWAKHSKGSTFDSVNSSDVRAVEISLPADPAEQAAIADVLSDMDAELEALEQRRAKVAALKQGMMQELLTGRTRLV